MSDPKKIRMIRMLCPLCDQEHDVEEWQEIAEGKIRDTNVVYEEHYFVCGNSPKDRQMFITGKQYNENHERAKAAYRTKELLGLVRRPERVFMEEFEKRGEAEKR